jgi:hypothetical protein
VRFCALTMKVRKIDPSRFTLSAWLLCPSVCLFAYVILKVTKQIFMKLEEILSCKLQIVGYRTEITDYLHPDPHQNLHECSSEILMEVKNI